jgi:uncharacterized repeat protein (TIGR01451 family)
VVYYLEAVDRAFNSFRTEEFHPRVVPDAADCREDEERPAYVEGPTSITVGATAAGATLPPGFLTEGITGTIAAAGRAAGGNGATLIGIGAAAGAAVGVGILVGGDSDATTTTAPSVGGVTTTIPVTTSIPSTTSVAPSAGPLVACFDTSPNPPKISVGETVRFDASCSRPRDEIASYTWDFNDGRDGREGRVINRQYTSPGVFPAELIVTNQAGNQARTSMEVRVEQAPAPPPGGGTPGPPNTADVQVSMSGPSNVAVGGTATYVVRVQNNGPLTANGISFNHSIAGSFSNYAGSVTGGFSSCTFTPPTVSCSNASMAAGAFFEITVSVRATTGGSLTSSASASSASPPDTVSNNSARRVTAVPLKAGDALETSFLSEIQSSSPGRVRTSIETNGLLTSASHGGGPSLHRMKPQPGSNVLAGYAEAPDLDGALWRLDFSQTEGFVAGSIGVESGELVSASSHAVVFRLSGTESRIRFRFRMEP